ncbi:MAG: hypothetical protein V4733_08840 [Verrucomicrobiota bacterium]
MSTDTAPLDSGVLIRRSLFFVLLAIMTAGNLFILFKGLSSPQAMDQAQIGREIARGNGLATKFIRPVAVHQASSTGAAPSLTNFQDTYHSPLNPLINAAVLKLAGGDQTETLAMGPNDLVYELDRVIAMVSTLFFLIAIGVNYLLVSRIFDARIAGVCAVLMLFCQTFWDYALSGLPQMLMLALFSCAIYFVYRALEVAAAGRMPMVPAMIAGVFFTLLALTHWMTVWIALGYIIFAAVAFRPRAIAGIAVLVMILIPSVFILLRNQEISGSPFGTAYLTLYNGLSNSTEASVMRAGTPEGYDITGLIGKIVRTTLLQATEIIPLLGKIIVAPLFFLALLHPFKRKPIADFRWAILLMWVTTAIGLAFFGVTTEALDPNQLHLLFAPIMTAYGLAFISILWSRLDVVVRNPILKNAHHVVIIAICALPLILALKPQIRVGMAYKDRGGIPQWPPYLPQRLNSATEGLKGWVNPNNVIFSDQPWATAWYADRISIWLPAEKEEFAHLEGLATRQQTPPAGIHISPSSHRSGTISDVARDFKDFTALAIDGPVLLATNPPGITIFDKVPKLQDVARRYPYRNYLVGTEMIFYSDRVHATPQTQ